MVKQRLCSWYWSACFFLIKALGWNIELRVKLSYVHKVRFPNWLYHPSKLCLHHRYGTLKTNMQPQSVTDVTFFHYSYIIDLWNLIQLNNPLSDSPDFYGDLVYKLKKIVGSNNFSAQFIKIISHYKKIGLNINVLQQTSCLVVNPITVGNFAFLFNCTPEGRTSDSMMVPT